MEHSLTKMRALLRSGTLRKAATAPAPMDPAGIPATVPPPAPMPGAPAGMPMDPAMMGGMPGAAPGGAMPPMDPAMMAGGMPPVDPAMMGGMPPMDTSAGMPPPEAAADAPPLDETPDEEETGRKGESTQAMLREILDKLDSFSDRMDAMDRRISGIADYDLGKDTEGTPDMPAPELTEPETVSALDLTKTASPDTPQTCLARFKVRLGNLLAKDSQ